MTRRFGDPSSRGVANLFLRDSAFRHLGVLPDMVRFGREAVGGCSVRYERSVGRIAYNREAAMRRGLQKYTRPTGLVAGLAARHAT